MRVVRCEQGSDLWRTSRLGVPTASQFKRILTPSTLKPSTQAEAYAAELAAELALGAPLDELGGGFVDRGTTLEGQARKWYEFRRDATVAQVGFCLRDDMEVGCSLDGLVGEDGLLEIKCLSAKHHAVAFVKPPLNDHRCQVQGQLWVTGRSWCDLLFFNPELPPRLVRCESDAKWVKAWEPAVEAFLRDLAAAKEQYAQPTQ